MPELTSKPEENLITTKKLQKINAKTHQENIKKFKESTPIVPPTTIKDGKVCFKIAKKTLTLPLKEVDKFLELSDEKMAQRFKKVAPEFNVDLQETRKEIIKSLPRTIKISNNVGIEPTIVRKQLLWKIQLYVNGTLKLTRRIENYWWSKNRRLILDIANSMNPKATGKQEKLNRALVEEALARWGKQNEILSKHELLVKFGYEQIHNSEPVEIELDEIYHHVGERVKVKGRVISVIKGVKDVRDIRGEHVKHILIYIDSVEGSGASIPVSHLPSIDEPDPDGIIEVEGTVEAQEVQGNRSSFSKPLMVMISTGEIKRTNLDVEEYTPTPEDLKDFQKHFGQINNENALDVIDQTLAPHVTGRSTEKMFAVLGWFTPRELPLRGVVEFLLTTLFAGDPRTCKDLNLEDLAENLSPITFVINAEMAKKTGLIGACDRDTQTGAWIIRWGKLVLADKLGAVLQGISSYEQENLRQMREILAKRKASIEKVVRGERRCRCRLLMSGNCRYDVDKYKTRLQAVRDTGSRFNQLFLELADWLRIHVPVPFAEGDVSFETIDKSLMRKDVKRLIPAEIFKKKVADTWRRTLEDYNIEDEIIKEVEKTLQHFRKIYPNVPIAMLKSEGLYIFLSHVVAFATLRNSVDVQNRITPEKSDVEFIKELWENLFNNLGLEVELQRIIQEEKMAKKIAEILVSAEEKEDLKDYTKSALTTYSEIINLLYSANKPMTKEELSKQLNISSVTVWSHKSKTEKYLYDFVPEAHKLIEGIPHVGLMLTSFGRLVAKAIENVEKS